MVVSVVLHKSSVIFVHFTTKRTMVVSTEKYPPHPGLYLFIHPDVGSLVEHYSVHNMWKVEWRYLFSELGREFLRPAMLMRADPFTEKVVNPCAVRLGDGKLRCFLMLGPFQGNELERVHKMHEQTDFKFYDSKFLHLAAAMPGDAIDDYGK